MLKVFAIYDRKVEAYMQPMFFQTVGQAVRGFSDACKDEKSNLAKHPGDFVLEQLGEFDEHSGELSPLAEIHKVVAEARDHVNPEGASVSDIRDALKR